MVDRSKILDQAPTNSTSVCAKHSHAPERGIKIISTDDSIVLKNRNTTVGYVLFSKSDRMIDYIFVHPKFRRNGFGRRLVHLAQRQCGAELAPAKPISPLGYKFFERLASSTVGCNC